MTSVYLDEIKPGMSATTERTVTERDIQHWRRQPTQIIVGLLFPVLIAIMSGRLSGSLTP